MPRPTRPIRRLAAALTLLVAGGAPAAAQSVTLKTVPVPTGEQFLVFPSANLGWGGLHVASDDPLLDPFLNPARGSRVEGFSLSTSPTFYGAHDESVGGRTLPLTVVGGGEVWFGTLSFALQQLHDPLRRNFPWLQRELADGQPLIQDDASDNSYVQLSLGRRLGDRTSVGASVYYADLGAVDGVNRLYARSVSIAQQGELMELRAGLLRTLDRGRTFEATVSRSNFDMTHDVHYLEWWWQRPGGAADPPQPGEPEFRSWTELNEDRTETWGARLRYTHPLPDRDLTLGAVVTAATKAHPRIPNYDIVNIPRDPGNSTVFNLGVGLEKRDGPVRFGAQLVFAPGRSHTWAFADTTVVTASGDTLRTGDETVDNRFRYGSWQLGVGLDRTGEKAGFQLGLSVYQYRYRLRQENYLADQRRDTREGWIEWSPSWGGTVRLGSLDLRYAGTFVAKGFPPLGWFGGVEQALDVPSQGGVDFIPAPTEPVSFPDFRVTTHRITVSVPLGSS
ncbi:MAG: hypothetical protein PVI57_05745 [Gemmatimonadota bacterium]|jgi:hypothetical protein